MTTEKARKHQLKHTWIAQSLTWQSTFTNFYGNCDFHEVPSDILERKLQSCLKLWNNKERIDKAVVSFKKRILHENESYATFLLKPTYINLASKDFTKSGVEVIFRLKHLHSGTVTFIDQIRSYKNWDDYIENNILPKGHIIYPEGGNYRTEVDFVLEKTIACSPKKLARQYIKYGVYAATTVSSVALAVTPLVPILAPASAALLGVSVGGSAYLGGEGVVQITDLVKHDEDLSPTNLRALGAYLDVATSIGGLVKGGSALALAKFTEDEALNVARILRCAGAAGTTLQRVSLLFTVISPIFEAFTLDDFKDFCLSVFNFTVDRLVPFARTLVSFYMLGQAIDTRKGIVKFTSMRGSLEIAEFLFKSALPILLENFSSDIIMLGSYFSNILCNKFKHLIPEYLDTEAFDRLSNDFLSMMNKMSIFFNISDISMMKISGFSFFSTFSVAAIRIVWVALRSHLNCRTNPHDHPLDRNSLVDIWLKFMNEIKCCSPQKLIEGTFFLLEQLSLNHRCSWNRIPTTSVLEQYRDLFLDSRSDGAEFNCEEPLLSLENMRVYLYYDTSKFQQSAKKIYREKLTTILRQTVDKTNSKYHKSGTEHNSVLYLSPCLKWKAAVFNKTELSNGKMMLFVTTVRPIT